MASFSTTESFVNISGLYWSSTGPNNTKVFYQPGQDGGGTKFGQEYIDVIAERYPGRRFENCFEWCAGPGFIGYSLLDHGLIDNLVLADLYLPVVIQAERTRQHPENNLLDRVTTYFCAEVAKLPEKHKFDLIVGNPPHYYHPPEVEKHDRLDCDPGWFSHKEFFSNAAQKLTDDGVILLQENWNGSQPETFQSWIDAGGLEITQWWQSKRWWHENDDCKIYYLEIRKKAK